MASTERRAGGLEADGARLGGDAPATVRAAVECHRATRARIEAQAHAGPRARSSPCFARRGHCRPLAVGLVVPRGVSRSMSC